MRACCPPIVSLLHKMEKHHVKGCYSVSKTVDRKRQHPEDTRQRRGQTVRPFKKSWEILYSMTSMLLTMIVDYVTSRPFCTNVSHTSIQVECNLSCGIWEVSGTVCGSGLWVIFCSFSSVSLVTCSSRLMQQFKPLWLYTSLCVLPSVLWLVTR